MTAEDLLVYTTPQVPVPFKLLWWLTHQGSGANDPGQAFDPGSSKEVYAQSLTNVTETYLANQHTNAANTLALLNAANYLFDRKAEWAAKNLYDHQTAAGQSHIYDRDYVLHEGQVDRNATDFVQQTIDNYNSIFRGYANLASQFTGTYDGMYWGISVGSSGNILSSAAENPELYVIAGVNIECSAGQYVYLPNDAHLFFVPKYGGASWSINITDASGNSVYSATPSDPGNTIIGVELDNEVGRYNIASSGFHVFATSASKAVSSSATMRAAILCAVPNGDAMDKARYLYRSGSSMSWDRIDSIVVASSVSVEIYGHNIPLVQMMDDIENAVARSSAMLTEASNYGQAYFNAIISSGGGTILPAPDVAFPDPSQMTDLTQEQISAIYFAYLNQLKDWFYTHTGTFDLGDVNISTVALDLTCRGSITDNNGNVLYDNLTVFTPFNSLRPITLRIGNNTMDQPGFAILWGRAASINGTFSASAGTYVELKQGYVLNIEQMFYKGQAVTEKTLDITTIEYVVSPDANTPNSPQGLTDAQWLINHWYWFVIAFGAVFVAAAAFTRNWIFAIIGILMVAVGAIGWVLADSSWSGGLLSGLFRRGP